MMMMMMMMMIMMVPELFCGHFQSMKLCLKGFAMNINDNNDNGVVSDDENNDDKKLRTVVI